MVRFSASNDRELVGDGDDAGEQYNGDVLVLSQSPLITCIPLYSRNLCLLLPLLWLIDAAHAA